MLSALAFLTVVGRPRAPGPRTLDWFPAIGALIGLALGGAWWLASRAWPPPVAAALVVGADLGLTGLLHFDGLVDAADGLLPPLERSRRLEVMAAPDAGAFGVGTAAVVVLARWAALAALRPGILLIAGLWCLSRTAMAAIARSRPYARGEGGLASSFAGPVRWPVLAGGAAGGAALCGFWNPVPGLVAAVGALSGAAVVYSLAQRRIGGYTGDVLGATAMVAETAGLVAASARW